MEDPELQVDINKLLSLLMQIPAGKVTTFIELARRSGIYSAQTVARILAANPKPEIFPSHRVVLVDGFLIDDYAGGGKVIQRQKLEAEGVIFNDRGGVDLDKYRYRWQ